MSAPEQVAVTATWVITLGDGATEHDAADWFRSDPVGLLTQLPLGERFPVSVTARPAVGLPGVDTDGGPVSGCGCEDCDALRDGVAGDGVLDDEPGVTR